MTADREDTPDERRIYSKIGAVLFWIDKANHQVGEDRVWNDVRAEYVPRGRRLWKTMQRHGLDVVQVPEATAG